MKAIASQTVWNGISLRGIYGQSWRKFATELYNEIEEDGVFNGAAALGFYFTLALFPAMIFLLSLLPLLPTPTLQGELFGLLQQFLPREAYSLVTETVEKIIAKDRMNLLSTGAVLTFWAASSGVYAIMQQLNVTYDVKDRRSYLKARGVAALLTLTFGALVIVSFLLIIGGQSMEAWIQNNAPAGMQMAMLFRVVRYLIIPTGLLSAFSIVYYFGPDVEQDFRFITPGSVLAALSVILVSVGFKGYVDNFANYNTTYGSLGAVIILMLWLQILGLVLILGSEINALIEDYNPAGKDKGEHDEGVPAEPSRTPPPSAKPTTSFNPARN